MKENDAKSEDSKLDSDLSRDLSDFNMKDISVSNENKTPGVNVDPNILFGDNSTNKPPEKYDNADDYDFLSRKFDKTNAKP